MIKLYGIEIVVLSRWTGNGFLVLGHIILLNVNPIAGILIKFFAFSLTLPYFVKMKLWDVVALSLVFCTIEMFKLWSILSGS